MAPIASKKAKRRIYVVYLIRNLLDRKRYIGKTSGPNAGAALACRWKQHLQSARAGARYKLSHAIRKHGADNFMIGQLYVCKTERAAFELEKREVARLRPEYNMTNGGEGSTGYRWNNELKAAISRTMKGKPKTPEHRAKISIAAKARNQSTEFKAAMSRRFLGKPLTEEHRAKLAVAAKARVAPRHEFTPAERAKAGRARKKTSEDKQCQMIL